MYMQYTASCQIELFVLFAEIILFKVGSESSN